MMRFCPLLRWPKASDRAYSVTPFGLERCRDAQNTSRASPRFSFDIETMKRVRRSDEFTADERNRANSVAFQGATLKASDLISRRTVHSNIVPRLCGGAAKLRSNPCVIIVYTLWQAAPPKLERR